MTPRIDIVLSADSLEAFARHFDDLFIQRSQREDFRGYLEELLAGREGRSLHRFLSESSWDARAVNIRRKELLFTRAGIVPTADGALVIDDKVVSVTSLFAAERVSYPLEIETCIPASLLAGGAEDHSFRSRQRIALDLVRREVAAGTPFRAVVADGSYGESEEFRRGLQQMGPRQEGAVGYVLRGKRSPYLDLGDSGEWEKVVRTFADGRQEVWWALEMQRNLCGPERAIIAATDPARLPESSTWFLVSNLPAPGSARAEESPLAPADLAEVVRLYGLHDGAVRGFPPMYHALERSPTPLRDDMAFRRHRTLVMCASLFVQWTQAESPAVSATARSVDPPQESQEQTPDLLMEQEEMGLSSHWGCSTGWISWPSWP